MAVAAVPAVRMPRGACAVPGCPGRADYRGRCAPHAGADRQARYTRNHESLYDASWKAASKKFIAGKACADCRKPAEVTDHSHPHRGNRELFWRRDLWVPRCWSCHSKKTVAADGGFGRTATARSATNTATPNRDDEAPTWG